MHPASPTPDQVCGRCRHFEPARHEPPDNPKYGYCKPREQLERDERGRPAGRMTDVATRCFMARWRGGRSMPAFEEAPRAAGA